MKYVRTENAIEEVLREEGELIFTRNGYIPKDMAIKASDSIEKLCNALVVAGEYEGKEFHKYFPTESDSFDGLKKRYEEYGCEIYGAIWTDKGLKYVAKGNGEGELELLMTEQLKLFEVGLTNKDYQIKKWTKKYVEYCNRVYEERGGSTGEYCCGAHWCCDECRGMLCDECADCVHTIKQIASELQIEIDYCDFDFEKLERKIYEAYARYKGWKIQKEEEK